jgi:hypothetical protein
MVQQNWPLACILARKFWQIFGNTLRRADVDMNIPLVSCLALLDFGDRRSESWMIKISYLKYLKWYSFLLWAKNDYFLLRN